MTKLEAFYGGASWEDLLALEPEDLAELVLRYLAERPAHEPASRRGFVSTAAGQIGGKSDDVVLALIEAWSWLEREGLLVPHPHVMNEGFCIISRRGQRLVKSEDEFRDFKAGRLLPRAALHPTVGTRVWADFVRGDYESAVFKAFREVEIAVRSGAKLPEGLVGKDLMRRAFAVDNGQLTDADSEPAERQATSDLFAGAIGLFKNPGSHRRVEFQPEAVAELLMLASYLMRVVDRRVAALSTPDIAKEEAE